MSLFENFNKPDYAIWKNQLLKDLKTDVFEKESVFNEIEEITIPAFISHEQHQKSESSPGVFPYERGLNKENNNFKNGLQIEVFDEKTANEMALSYLMKGVDSLFFKIEKNEIDWQILFQKIEIQHIEVHIKCNFKQLKGIIAHLDIAQLNQCIFHFDRTDLLQNKSKWIEIIKLNPIKVFNINGFILQQTGANTSQEIAFCLAEAQEILHILVAEGLDIDTASATIHFSIGVGSQYLYEIAKIKVLKKLWSEIIKAYAPKHNCSYNCFLTAHIGWLNKSLKDPYTNLLRQSTELMSAIAGGVQSVFNHPYDAISKDGPTEFARQYCINIPLVLKEESYFDLVIDPVGGSYTLHQIENELTQKSWALFIEIEKNGGISQDQAKDLLIQKIKKTAQLRIQQIKENKQILIGVNKFPNLENLQVSYKDAEDFLGLKTLNLERDK